MTQIMIKFLTTTKKSHLIHINPVMKKFQQNFIFTFKCTWVCPESVQIQLLLLFTMLSSDSGF